jgi:arsenite methyltransferase
VSKDLMFTDDIQELVREAYQGLVSPAGPGTRFYDPDQLADLPDGARQWALGVGNPIKHAALRPGETVLDMGCGSGIDVLLAARAVGETGRAIGVDFLESMIERGRCFALQAGLDSASFVRSEIENVDLPDETADVVVSNGSINLSARKSRAFAEAFRLLRPGGRLCVSDPTLSEDELPVEILTHPSAWAG